ISRNFERDRTSERTGTVRRRHVGGVRTLGGLAAALGLVTLPGGCEALSVLQKATPASQPAKAGAPTVPVSIAKAVRTDVPVQVKAIAWAEAYATVTIRPQVDGQLQKVHFVEGQDLNEGDELFTIDPRPFEAAQKLAEANLARDRAM